MLANQSSPISERLLERFDPLLKDRVIFGACIVHSRVVLESSFDFSPAAEKELAEIIADLGSTEVSKNEVFFSFDDETCIYAVSQNEDIVIVHYPNQSDSSLVAHASRNALTMNLANKGPDSENTVKKPSEPQNPWREDSSSPAADGLFTSEGVTGQTPAGRLSVDEDAQTDRIPKSDEKDNQEEEQSATPPAIDNFVGLELASDTEEMPEESASNADAPAPAPTGGLLKKKSATGAQLENIAWTDFRSELEGILSKVIGDGQAAQMVRRHMNKYDINEMMDYPTADLATFGGEILARVPDKTKRKILTSEFEAYLKG